MQGADKVVAVQGSPLPKGNNKDAQETSCLQDAVGNHRHICDAAFRDAQSPWQHEGSRGFFVGHDGERKQVYQTRVDDVAKVEDVLHEEGPSGNGHGGPTGTRQWWRMWLSSSADVHAGSGTLWYNCMEAMDAPTVGAVLQADSTEQRGKFEQQRGCTLAVQVFRKTPKVTRE